MNILLINQYAGNKGDRAVLYAMCVMLIRRYPDCQIIVSTSSPELWEGYSYYEDHHIKFIPSAWDYSNITQPSIYWRFLNKFKKYTFTILRESALKGFKLYRFLANPSFYNLVRWLRKPSRKRENHNERDRATDRNITEIRQGQPLCDRRGWKHFL